MASLHITSEVLKEHKIDISEAILLLSIVYNVDMDNTVAPLINKGFIGRSFFQNKPTNNFFLTDKGKDAIEGITLASEPLMPKEDVLRQLAVNLQVIFPQGKKYGTNYYWRSNVSDIVRKLQAFYKKYGNNYTHEEILDAAKRYVDSYKNGNTYMQLLKYFIWKKNTDTGEETSELMNYIENKGAIENANNADWTSTLT